MLIIFVFFSVTSMFLVACFSVAVLNVVIRRESAYLIEERINGIVDNCKRLTPFLLDRVQGCHAPASNSPLFTEYPGAVWPGAQSFVTVLPKGGPMRADQRGSTQALLLGIVVDRGSLEIRSFSTAERQGCSVTSACADTS